MPFLEHSVEEFAQKLRFSVRAHLQIKYILAPSEKL